jgi:hypothetical protein
MRSITYWHPLTYSWLIRLSYGKGYNSRYETVARLIPSNATVLDVCCGDTALNSFISDDSIDYVGLDFNQGFVRHAQKRGLTVHQFDIYQDTPPKADYVVILGSLYQFIDKIEVVMNKLIGAARKTLIISEPVVNKVDSSNFLVSKLALWMSDPGDGARTFKFNATNIEDILVAPYRDRVVDTFLSAGGIERVIVYYCA